MKQLDQQYAPLNMVAMISRHGSEQQATNARDAELLTRERLCRALSMFEVFMQRVKQFFLKEKVWGCCVGVAVNWSNRSGKESIRSTEWSVLTSARSSTDYGVLYSLRTVCQ